MNTARPRSRSLFSACSSTYSSQPFSKQHHDKHPQRHSQRRSPYHGRSQDVPWILRPGREASRIHLRGGRAHESECHDQCSHAGEFKCCCRGHGERAISLASSCASAHFMSMIQIYMCQFTCSQDMNLNPAPFLTAPQRLLPSPLLPSNRRAQNGLRKPRRVPHRKQNPKLPLLHQHAPRSELPGPLPSHPLQSRGPYARQTHWIRIP